MTTSHASTPGTAMTRRRISVPIFVANWAGQSGEAGLAALRKLVMLDLRQRALDVDVVELGDVAADDFVLDFRGQVDLVLCLQILGKLHGHEIIELPVGVPDRKIRPI